MLYKIHLKFGWDKTIIRRFNTLQECNAWLDRMYTVYLPSQIVATWIHTEAATLNGGERCHTIS
jgi:hypothetical protein